jgi:hypothetical protein
VGRQSRALHDLGCSQTLRTLHVLEAPGDPRSEELLAGLPLCQTETSSDFVKPFQAPPSVNHHKQALCSPFLRRLAIPRTPDFPGFLPLVFSRSSHVHATEDHNRHNFVITLADKTSFKLKVKHNSSCIRIALTHRAHLISVAGD